LIFNIVVLQSLLPFQLIGGFLPIKAATGLVGGAITAGMVGAAKRAPRTEHQPSSDVEMLTKWYRAGAAL
jgi:hypothetical protein